MLGKFKFRIAYKSISFSLLIIVLAFSQIDGKEKSIEKMIEDSKLKQVTALTCHVCHSETDDGCFNFTESGYDFEGFPQSCQIGHNRCMVKKFAITITHRNGTTSPMKTFSVKRNCTDRCDNGCVIMGERTRLYVCSTCCTTPLCNVGSGSSSIFNHFGIDFHYVKTFLIQLNTVLLILVLVAKIIYRP